MRTLSLIAQTVYAELLDQLMALDARRSMGAAPGAFVEKRLPSGTYVYFQYSEPGSVKQVYIGRKSRELDATVERYVRERAALQGDRSSIDALAAALRGAGVTVTDSASGRVLSALADVGVFKLGGVLVGTQAFIVLGNVLGVVWDDRFARTADIDVGASARLEVGLPQLEADVPRALEALEMGFLPVPGFAHDEPSTSYTVRGRDLRVDLVTPAREDRSGPVRIPRFKAAAAPVRFLELLLDEPQPAAIVANTAVLVSVPAPASFAVHKLLVAQDRSPAFQAKARKDVAQAAQLIEALADLRPGDLERAVKTTRARGKRWRAAFGRGLDRLRVHHPGAHELIAGV